MRIYHQLYRQSNPPPKPLRGKKKQLHGDMYRMLRGFTSNPPPKFIGGIRKPGASLTEGIAPSGYDPTKKVVKKAVSPRQRARQRLEEKEAKELAKLTGEKRADARAKERQETPSKTGYGAYIQSGQTKFERGLRDILPSEISAKHIVRERDTTAAWNFLGMIEARMRKIAIPTGKICPAEEAPWSYVPKIIRPGTRKNVCLPIGLHEDRFEWFKVEDHDEWDRLIRLRNVVRAAVEKRLSGPNLDASLTEAIRDLSAKESKAIEEYMRLSYTGPQEDFSKMPAGRRRLGMWQAGQIGEAAREAAEMDPGVRKAKSRVSTARGQIAKRAQKEAARERIRKQERELIEERTTPKKEGKVTAAEQMLGIEYVAAQKERDKEAREDRFSELYNFHPADERLWAFIGDLLQKKGVTGKSILPYRIEQRRKKLYDLQALYTPAQWKAAYKGKESPIPSSDILKEKALSRSIRDLTDAMKRDRSNWRFGPFPKNMKLDAGTQKSSYIPPKDLKALLIRLDRSAIPPDSRLLGSKHFTNLRNMLLKARVRGDKDRDRLAEINSKMKLRDALKEEMTKERDKAWAMERRKGRKPKIVISEGALKAELTKRLKKHREIVNARWKTAKIIIYEEFGGRALEPGEVKIRKFRESKSPGVVFDMGGGIRGWYSKTDKSPIKNKHWIWMLMATDIDPKSVSKGKAKSKEGLREVPVIQGYSASKEKASQGINIAHRIYKKLMGLGDEAGYDTISSEDRRWLRENRPKLSEGIAALLLNTIDRTIKGAEKERAKGKKGVHTEVLQYLIRESREFGEEVQVAKKKITKEESRWTAGDHISPGKLVKLGRSKGWSSLSRMTAGETRTHMGRGYRLGIRRMMRGDKYEITVKTKSTTHVQLISGTPKKVEARAFAIAGTVMGAEKVDKALKASNPSSSLKRLNASARRGLRRKNPALPREVVETGTFEEMSPMFALPDDVQEAYNLGISAGIIQGIDTCGVQNWARRRKLRKEYEAKMTKGFLKFQKQVGARRGRVKMSEPTFDQSGQYGEYQDEEEV